MNSNNSANTPFHLVFTPLVYPPFVKYAADVVIAPGAPKFIDTENSLKLSTENDLLITTET